MCYLLFFSLSTGFLVVLLNLLSYFLSESSLLSREELSSYECGFEHHGLSRVPFSFRYFYLTLVFLLFDLEIVLLLFSYLSIFSLSWALGALALFIFIWLLLLGLFFEWSDGGLDWLS